MTEGTPLRKPQPPDPLQCDQGCYPPHRPLMARDENGDPEPLFQNETYSYQDGDRWVCPHGAAYVARSNRDWGRPHHRNWRRLRGWDERQARRDAGQDVDEPPTILAKIARRIIEVFRA